MKSAVRCITRQNISESTVWTGKGRNTLARGGEKEQQWTDFAVQGSNGSYAQMFFQSPMSKLLEVGTCYAWHWHPHGEAWALWGTSTNNHGNRGFLLPSSGRLRRVTHVPEQERGLDSSWRDFLGFGLWSRLEKQFEEKRARISWDLHRS